MERKYLGRISVQCARMRGACGPTSGDERVLKKATQGIPACLPAGLIADAPRRTDSGGVVRPYRSRVAD